MSRKSAWQGMVDLSSLTCSPPLLPPCRSGYRYGSSSLVDGLERDGLSDAFAGEPMGNFAELCAAEHSLSREQQDDHAVTTCKRAIAARDGGLFDWEITTVGLPEERMGSLLGQEGS